MNKAAQQLGRLAKGKAKTLSNEERKRRAERLSVAREKRWPSTQNPSHHDGAASAPSVDGVVGRSESKEE